MNHTNITCKPIAINQRIHHTAEIFGIGFPLRVEPAVYQTAEALAETYDGGYWEFYTLSNGGFYMAPATDRQFKVSCQNGFEGVLSADALGITVCLYVYSDLSFGQQERLAEVCASQYHWLRAYMLEHTEARMILAAID